MVHVVSSQRSRGDEVKDGWVDATDYLNFLIFVVLGHNGSLIISFSIIRTPRAGREVSIRPSLSNPLAIVVF
jgi:hypothetical protein